MEGSIYIITRMFMSSYMLIVDVHSLDQNFVTCYRCRINAKACLRQGNKSAVSYSLPPTHTYLIICCICISI